MKVFTQNNELYEGKDIEDFKKEENLEDLIIDHPEIIPISDISDNDKFIPITRQMHVSNHGDLDILGVDDIGNIYILECKLQSNSDKKKIRGQITDYVAGLHAIRNDFQKFLDMISMTNTYETAKENKFYKKDLRTILLESLPDATTIDDVMQGIKNNFQNSKWTSLIVIDRISPLIRETVNFHNDLTCNNENNLYALQVQKYSVNNNSNFLTVDVYPAPDTLIRNKPGERYKNNEEKFNQQLQQNNNLNNDQKIKIKQFLDDCTNLVQKQNGNIEWGTGVKAVFLPKFAHTFPRAPIKLRTDGRIELQFQMLESLFPELRTEFIKQLCEIPEIRSEIEAKEKTSYNIQFNQWSPNSEKILKIMDNIFSN